MLNFYGKEPHIQELYAIYKTKNQRFLIFGEIFY